MQKEICNADVVQAVLKSFETNNVIAALMFFRALRGYVIKDLFKYKEIAN